LYGKRKKVVPTGFKAFDDKNGGFLEGSLVTIAANSGGGKSALGNVLALNIAQHALEDVLLVPLEMTEEQMWARSLAVMTGIDVHKIQQQKITDSEKKVLKKAFIKFSKDLKKKNTRHTVWSPEEDLGIEEMLFMVKPYNFKVIIIDYIGLLKGADGDDQVKELGRIARFAKVFAKNTGSIVVLLAQLSDEGQVKYAKAIKEHSNNLWTWHMNEDEAPESILDINQQKARNQLRFKFQLLSHNNTGNITDVGDDYVHVEEEKPKNGHSKRGSRNNKYSSRTKKEPIKKEKAEEGDDYLNDLNDSDSDESGD
jgi:archaellum biogenesis ATPase FlaH